MHPLRPALGALALLYAATAQAAYAVDTITGERGTAVGAALLIGAVATAAGTLLYRSSQAAARSWQQAMRMLDTERAEHVNTRQRLERSEARLDAEVHRRVQLEEEVAHLRHQLEEITTDRR